MSNCPPAIPFWAHSERSSFVSEPLWSGDSCNQNYIIILLKLATRCKRRKHFLCKTRMFWLFSCETCHIYSIEKTRREPKKMIIDVEKNQNMISQKLLHLLFPSTSTILKNWNVLSMHLPQVRSKYILVPIWVYTKEAPIKYKLSKTKSFCAVSRLIVRIIMSN